MPWRRQAERRKANRLTPPGEAYTATSEGFSHGGSMMPSIPEWLTSTYRAAKSAAATSVMAVGRVVFWPLNDFYAKPTRSKDPIVPESVRRINELRARFSLVGQPNLAELVGNAKPDKSHETIRSIDEAMELLAKNFFFQGDRGYLPSGVEIVLSEDPKYWGSGVAEVYDGRTTNLKSA
ncbi:MAG: hypothetical protein ABIA93_05380 [Candidatus Woesearchaeota archaeon]